MTTSSQSAPLKASRPLPMVKERIRQIEDYVKQLMSAVTAPELRIAHGFEHTDRVRH